MWQIVLIMPLVRCGVLDVGCWVLDDGCGMLGDGCGMSGWGVESKKVSNLSFGQRQV